MAVYDSYDHVRVMSKEKVIRFLVKKVHQRRENPGYAKAGLDWSDSDSDSQRLYWIRQNCYFTN